MCKDFYCLDNGRPSIPPEQLFLALLGGYLHGTLVRADVSHKSFVPMEVYQTPEKYRETISGKRKTERGRKDDGDKGNPTVDFKGQNGVMENRNRILVGLGVEVFQGPTSEREGALSLLEKAKKRLRLKPRNVGADKGYFEKKFIKKLLSKRIALHVAAHKKGRDKVYTRVRMRQRGWFCSLSQRARKKIEELWGEAKEEHGFRRFMSRTLGNVRQEAWMIGWLLNIKRLAALQAVTTG